MATRLKSRSKDLYDEDFYVWTETQAQLLRAGRFGELDLEHLIEEVDDLGGALKRFVRSRARTIMEHFLKLQHSPAQDPGLGWRETIRAQRSELLGRPHTEPAACPRRRAFGSVWSRASRCRGVAA